MTQTGKQDQFRLGFLTAIEDPDVGFVGGLLVTNRFGRPLEFQCTTPVKPNRTQQILYGPTLRPYLLTELIGRTLVEKIGVKPHLVLVEQEDLLSLREQISIPVASFSDRHDELQIGRYHLHFPEDHAADRDHIATQITQVPNSADLKEPFERIREALGETLKLRAA